MNKLTRRDILQMIALGAVASVTPEILAGCSTKLELPPTPPTDPIYGVTFSPFIQANQDPNQGTVVSSDQLTSMLTDLKGYTHWVRTFGVSGGLELVPAIAKGLGFKTAIGAYIGSDSTYNSSQIGGLIKAANAGNVDLAIVGSEAISGHTQSEADVLSHIETVRSHVPKAVKITYVDTWDTIVHSPNIIRAVDVVAVNVYPFYDNVAIENAVQYLQNAYSKAQAAAKGKSVIIAETGWPSAGNPLQADPNSVPSADNASEYFINVETWARQSAIPLFYFSAFDEPWKANYNDFSSWGIWDSSANLKEGNSGVFQN